MLFEASLKLAIAGTVSTWGEGGRERGETAPSSVLQFEGTPGLKSRQRQSWETSPLFSPPKQALDTAQLSPGEAGLRWVGLREL